MSVESVAPEFIPLNNDLSLNGDKELSIVESTAFIESSSGAFDEYVMWNVVPHVIPSACWYGIGDVQALMENNISRTDRVAFTKSFILTNSKLRYTNLQQI